MTEIMIDLQGGAKAPLYEKIYEHIKREILSGKLQKGEKLPSTRLLATNLAVSRSTVEMAYDQLLAEGYIKAEPCRGFFICDITELYSLESLESVIEADEEREREDGCEIDFSPYVIDTRNFPYNIWRKVNKNVLLDDREELLLSGNGQGEWELRIAIARYLHQARGVNCRACDIILGAGNEYLEILLSQLLGRDKTILMENPGYPQAYRTFCNMGYRVETVAAGIEGLDVASVQSKNPDLVYMMPSHQFPMGTVMPLAKRLELIKWAAEKEERYLIEDDHDSEYRYRGKPIPSLQSVDRYGKVIYLGTFSKSIAPSLRISYMVLPPQLMKRYRSECGFYSTTVARMQQEALKEFIVEGHFERHLNKMRGIYRGRHDFFLGELKKRTWVNAVRGEHAGLHFLVEVATPMDEEDICRMARAKGVKVSGIRQYYLNKEQQMPQVPILVLGYGKLNEDEIRTGLLVLDEILKNDRGGEHYDL